MIEGRVLTLGMTVAAALALLACVATSDLLGGRFQWRANGPLVGPAERPEDPCRAIKDPSIVLFGGKWHLFCTIRSQKRTHAVEYLSFADWAEADRAPRQILNSASTGYFCAPQVFYFRPQGKWYLIGQASDETWAPKYQPAYSTSADIGDPASWTKVAPLTARKAPSNAWLDFWVVCDEAKAYLFFTSLDGKLWREETALGGFPEGWSEPVLALEGDIFEAAHIYRLKGPERYLALVEAQGGQGWRYYKAYVASKLDGAWTPVADTREKAFASMGNVRFDGERWTDCISHGELIRAGYDERMEVDPAGMRFVFQGVLDRDRAGKGYGDIPWRLGMLEAESER